MHVLTRRAAVIAASCLALGGALLAHAARAGDPMRESAHVDFALGDRFGPDYRWQFHVRVHLTDRGTGRGIANLRLSASGAMNDPGMAMRTVPATLTSSGGGWYDGSLAFYMPGPWRIRIVIGSPGIAPHVTTVRVVIPVSQ